MRRGFAPHRSAQSGHLCCRFQPILYDNSVYLFRHTSTPDFVRANAVHRIRTCKPFTANDFQDRSLTTRTYGRYDSVVELPYLKLLLPLLYTISCGLFTAYGKVHPCRKLAQCVGFEPTRRINARRLSKPFQYHYGNTACDGFLPKLPSYICLEPTSYG